MPRSKNLFHKVQNCGKTYLLRIKDAMILLATRLPATNLRISRDECKMWSESILVDSVFGLVLRAFNLIR